MKKSTRITLWVVGILVGSIVLFETCADLWISHYAEKRARIELQKAQLPYEIDFESINIEVATGCAVVNGIKFTAGPKALKGSGLDTVYAEVQSVDVNFFRYGKLLREKVVAVHSVDVNKLTAKIKVSKTKMYVEADSVSVTVHDLSYNLKDSTIGYNDSIYELDVQHFLMKVPESLIAIEAHNVHTEDGGEITTGKTRIWNNLPKHRLGEIRQEPVTWIDLQLRKVELSPMNLFRTDFTKGITIPQVMVAGDKMDVFRDVRFPPKHPYGTPQQVLLAMKYPITVEAIECNMKALNVEVMCTDKNVGSLVINDMKATVCDFSNKRGSTTHLVAAAKMGSGDVGGTINLHMNSKSQFDADLHGKGINTSALTSLIRPLAAIELNCIVDSMKLKYTGDDYGITGNMLLAYHGLNGRVYAQDDIPYKIISKNAGALEYFVNHLIPKSNPRLSGKEPTAYHVEYLRKDTQPFPLYMCMPLILGAVETFLPGFNVHKKVKDKNEL